MTPSATDKSDYAHLVEMFAEIATLPEGALNVNACRRRLSNHAGHLDCSRNQTR